MLKNILSLRHQPLISYSFSIRARNIKLFLKPLNSSPREKVYRIITYRDLFGLSHTIFFLQKKVAG